MVVSYSCLSLPACLSGSVLTGGPPAQYVGYAIGGLGVLGHCGVNIWHGGPIDPRNDPTGDPPVPQLDGLRKGK